MFDSAAAATAAPYDEWEMPIQLPYTDENGSFIARATLDRLLATQPGPDVLTVAATLSDIEDLLSPAERIDLGIVLERCSGWVEAIKQPVFAGIRRDAGGPSTSTGEPGRFEDTSLELGLALRWSEWMVHDRMDVAHELARRLPRTWEVLAEGRLSYRKAREIALGAQQLDGDADALALETRVLGKAAAQTPAEVRRSVQRQVMKLDPDGAERRREQARRDRMVSRSRGEDGESVLRARGPAESVAVIDRALFEGAQQLKATGQVDTLDQGRFDTLLAWAVGHLDGLPLPERGPLPVAATVIVKASTAAHDDDDPADLVGFGPITAQAARDLITGTPLPAGPFEKNSDGAHSQSWYLRDEGPWPAAEDDDPPEADDVPPRDWQWQPPSDSARHSGAAPPTRFPSPPVTWRALRVDSATGWALPPPGVRMNFGRSRRFASPRQARYVRDRDRTCAVPTCAMPAERSDIDHRGSAAEGGATDVANLGPACPHHNRTTRNRSDWTIEPNGDGTATLITPQGRRYPIRPHHYLD